MPSAGLTTDNAVAVAAQPYRPDRLQQSHGRPYSPATRHLTPTTGGRNRTHGVTCAHTAATQPAIQHLQQEEP